MNPAPARRRHRARAPRDAGPRRQVTTISGVPLAGDALVALAGELKRRCGTGGSVKEYVIEIQGDHRDTVVAELEQRGYTVKRAGG